MTRQDIDPHAFCELPYLKNVGLQKRLRLAMCKRMRRHLWTPADAVTFVPALSDRLYGNGRALLGLTTINSRPRYYILRIDSTWSIDSDPDAPDGAALWVDRIDAISFALEEEFGCGRYEGGEESDETEKGRDRRRKWPAYDDENGCSWWRMDWPKLPRLKTIPHPLAPRFSILAATL
jgi:hypothetical protein